MARQTQSGQPAQPTTPNPVAGGNNSIYYEGTREEDTALDTILNRAKFGQTAQQYSGETLINKDEALRVLKNAYRTYLDAAQALTASKDRINAATAGDAKTKIDALREAYEIRGTALKTAFTVKDQGLPQVVAGILDLIEETSNRGGYLARQVADDILDWNAIKQEATDAVHAAERVKNTPPIKPGEYQPPQ